MERIKSPVRMSSRLHKVAAMITPGLVVADIGTDHGYIPIYQVLTGNSAYAYACDVAEGPLERAAGNIRFYNVGDRVKTVLSDGLSGLCGIREHVPEAIVIAGMGGSLICRILSAGKDVAMGAEELVLSPHSEWYEVRCFLQDNGYRLIDEDMLKEDGKYYVILKAVHKKKGELPGQGGAEGESLKAMTEDELKFGPVLIEKKHPVLREYLAKELDTCGRIIKNLTENAQSASKGKISEFEEKEAVLGRVLGNINNGGIAYGFDGGGKGCTGGLSS